MQHAIITADTHLLKKPGLWASRTEIAGDDVFALQQIAQAALKYNADVFILGDAVDAALNFPRPITVMKHLLSPVIEKGLQVNYIQGQHDFVAQAHYENYPWLSLIDGTNYIHGQSFKFLGLSAYAMDYFPESMSDLCMSKIPRNAQVLMLHGTIDTVNPMNSHFRMDQVPDSVKYLFMGDWHPATMLTEKRKAGNLYAYYPGSTYLGSVTEPIEKSFLLATLDDRGAITIAPEKLLTRPMYRYSDVKSDLSVVRYNDETLPEALRKPLILLDEMLDKEVTAKLAETAHVYTEPSLLKPKGEMSLAPLLVAPGMSDAEILGLHMDKEKYKDEFAFTLDVIQNPVNDALGRLREALGVNISDLAPKKMQEDETIVLDGGTEE